MNYLSIKELKELIKDLPDDEQIYFAVDRNEDLCWPEQTLIREADVINGNLYLSGKKITYQEQQEKAIAQKLWTTKFTVNY